MNDPKLNGEDEFANDPKGKGVDDAGLEGIENGLGDGPSPKLRRFELGGAVFPLAGTEEGGIGKGEKEGRGKGKGEEPGSLGDSISRGEV